MSDSALTATEHTQPRDPSGLEPGIDYRRSRGVVAMFRHNEFLFVLLLLLINTFNLTDFAFTVQAIDFGHKELNPVLEYFFRQDVAAGGMFKLALVIALTTIMWIYRTSARIVAVALLIAFIFAALFLYHIYGMLVYIAPQL